MRRRYDGQIVEERARDVIATGYQHTTARGVEGAKAPDPQLHTHVVMSGAVREDDGRLVAVWSRAIFRHGRELGAFYRSALAQELAQQGYAIEAGTGTHGRYFEIGGVPRELCDAFSARRREIIAAAERFRAKHGRAPERGELRDLALENRRAKQLSTERDLQHVWNATGAEQDFGYKETASLIGRATQAPAREPLRERVQARLTEREALFTPSALRAVAFEQSVGELSPQQAVDVTRNMIGERSILTLEGGHMTTLAVRDQEQAIERSAALLAEPVSDQDAGDVARELASREVAERIGAPLSVEQQQALGTLTGPERLAVLIGPAGTGKGVVIDAAARTEQTFGRDVLGIAVSGSTADRLGTDSPALAQRTLTLDALVSRANRGIVEIGPDTTVILDEAGMVDHQRMDALTEVIERTRREADRRRRRPSTAFDWPWRHVRPSRTPRTHSRTRRDLPHP